MILFLFCRKNLIGMLFGRLADNEFIKGVSRLKIVGEGNRLFFFEYHFYKSRKTVNLWKRILIHIILLICCKQIIEQAIAGLVLYIYCLSLFIESYFWSVSEKKQGETKQGLHNTLVYVKQHWQPSPKICSLSLPTKSSKSSSVLIFSWPAKNSVSNFRWCI